MLQPMALWMRCWNRIRSWQPPPRWAVQDWQDEARAQAALAETLARHDFDPTRGVPLEAFVFRRVVEAVWNRYRQEWSFGRRAKPLEVFSTEAEAVPFRNTELDEQMTLALKSLNETERQFIYRFFWTAASIESLSVEMGISREALKKRKARTLLKLRRMLQDPS